MSCQLPREAPQSGGGKWPFQLHMPAYSTPQYPPSPISPDGTGAQSLYQDEYNHRPPGDAIQTLPTPDTASTKPYFDGSNDPRDYIIDLEQDVESFAPDVKGYFECVGRCLEQKTNGGMACYGDKGRRAPRPYIPDDRLVSMGLDYLRSEYRKPAHERVTGLWFELEDITSADMESFPHYPWLGSMIRQGGIPAVNQHVLQRRAMWKEAMGEVPDWYITFGNVRAALPSDIWGPGENPYWIEILGDIYGGYDSPPSMLCRQPYMEDVHINHRIHEYVYLDLRASNRKPDNVPPVQSLFLAEEELEEIKWEFESTGDIHTPELDIEYARRLQRERRIERR